MKEINFKKIQTTNLGFGTSSLTKNNSLAGALENLNTAYDLGIRHFDTAPLYGFGNAESIVGKFAKSKRKNLTITTKYGLKTRKLPLRLLPLINMSRKLAKKLVAKKKVVNTKSNEVFEENEVIIFPGELIKGIEDSLQNLQTDYIDVFLLHEVSTSSANNEDLIDTLLKQKEKGKIKEIGLGSEFNKIHNKKNEINNAYSVIQFNDQVKQQNINKLNDDNRLFCRHGMFFDLKLAQSFLDEIGNQDISSVQLCIEFFKRTNKNSISIFSSSRNENIKQTINFWNHTHNIPDELWNKYLTYLK